MSFGVDIVSMLLGGLAAGMVLFIVSVGLSVTMGLMGFVNLAHGAFAMLGGYVIALTMRNWDIGFAPALAIGFIVIALWLGFERTRFGAQIRAAVDNRRMAESLGINIDRLFMVTFGFGSGMAALGGGLGAEFLGLDPQYALKYLVYFLIVVSVGGLGRITGVFFASLIIGVLDFALKKYLPQGGTVFVYALTILLLLLRPQGLFGGKTA